MAKPVTPDEAVESLARAVIEKAVEDFFFGSMKFRWEKKAQHKRALSKVSALQFLVSDDCEWWADMANREFDVNELLKQPERAKRALMEYGNMKERQ